MGGQILMAFETFIARKHLTHRRGFIFLIHLISMIGIGLGVMVLIATLAVMSGFDRELQSKIVNVQPHLRIEKFGGIEDPEQDIRKILARDIPGLEAVAGFMEGQAIIRSENNATGVIIKGLDPKREDLAIYKKHMLYGALDFSDRVTRTTHRKFLLFKKTEENRMGGIFVGEELAARLNVEVGDQVTLIVPFQDPRRPLSLTRAAATPFLVKGIFRVGMNDFDSSLAIIGLGHAQSLYRMEGRVTGISLRFHHVEDAQKWKWRLRDDFNGDYVLRSWYDMNQSFFQALKVEKSLLTILLAFIVLVATFNIVSSLIMVVMEKTKDIGILRALGATKANIARIFVLESFGIGFFGIVTGAVLGPLVAYNLNPISDFIKRIFGFELFPSDIYYFDRIPVEVHPEDVVMIVIFAMAASLLAGFYPAHRAASLHPVEALRYE